MLAGSTWDKPNSDAKFFQTNPVLGSGYLDQAQGTVYVLLVLTVS